MLDSPQPKHPDHFLDLARHQQLNHTDKWQRGIHPKAAVKILLTVQSCKVSDMLDLFFGHELGVGETNKNLVKKFEIYKKESLQQF